MKAKIFQKKENNKSSSFEMDISSKEAKSLKVSLSSLAETIFPTLKITDKSKKEEFVEFNEGDFFTLEISY